MLMSMMLICGVTTLSAQSADVPADLISAFDAGNASAINNYLAPHIELAIGDKNDIYSKQQASGIINDFFRSKRNVSFDMLHKGNKDAATFVVGVLKTSAGTFRVTLYMQGSSPLIQKLRIDSSNE